PASYIRPSTPKGSNPPSPAVKLRLKSFPLVCALLLAAFTGLYGIATWRGNLQTNDSRNYLAIARNLAAGNGFADAEGDPVVYWPPLYPLVLRVGAGHPGAFVFGLHLLCMGGVFLLWLRLAGRQLASPRHVLLYGAYLVTATPLLMIATFVWSEALFLLLFSAYLAGLHRYVNTPENRWLLWAAVPGFLMLLVRNAGIFGFAGALLGLWATVGKRLDRKYLLLHVGLVLSGWAVWNADRLLLNGNQHVFGQLLPAFQPLRNAKLVLGELGANFLPSQPLALVGGALVLGGLAAFAWFWRTGRIREPFAKLLFVLILTYLGAWVIIPAHPDDISRFLSLVWPALYLVLLRTVEAATGSWGPTGCTLAWVGLWLGLVYPVVRVVYNALHWGSVNPVEVISLVNDIRSYTSGLIH
ncbi:MAG TPA: hypothetical protein VF646_20175, partial [Cytophagales bacterium]